jgi:hypothetical protein
MTALVAGMPPESARSPQHIARIVLLGVLWGIAVSAMESVTIPVPGEGWATFWRVMAWIVPGWSIVGIAIAAAVEAWGARFTRPAVAAAALVASALALSALWSTINALPFVRGANEDIALSAAGDADPLGPFAYQFWVVLFYGGFYVLAWKLDRASARTRESLRRAELARLDAEIMLGEAQLQLLRGCVEPGLLLRVVSEVERRYVNEGARADALLERLAHFLRLAMPAIRDGHTTLDAELKLVGAFEVLGADLDARPTRWTVMGAVPPDIAFPPLLLLPLLDALAAAMPRGARGSVAVTSDGDAVALRVHAGPVGRDWLSADLGYRLRVGLSGCHGEAWRLVAHATAGETESALEIALRPQSSQPAGTMPARP